MAKKDFDNVLQVYSASITVDDTETLTAEIDFELPRGYIAKIREVRFHVEVLNTNAVFDGDMKFALVNDPDDDDTTEIPNQEVDHDVICEGFWTINEAAANGWIFFTHPYFIYKFDENMDVVAARPMRFNVVSGEDFNSGIIVTCIVYYTLEKVGDELMMELLDIL